MRAVWGIRLAFLALGFVTGCVKVDQTIELKADGSGMFHMTYGMSEQTIAQMESMKAMTGEMEGDEESGGNPFDFDEVKLREAFQGDEIEGLRLLDVKSSVKDGWKFMTVRLAFDNLATLAKTDFFQENGLSLTKNEAGNYVLTQAAQEAHNEGDDMDMNDPMMAAMMQQMAPMFAGMRIEMNIKTPGKVISSNGTEHTDKQVRWVYDVDSDPSIIAQIQQFSMRVEFDGTGLNLETFSTPRLED